MRNLSHRAFCICMATAGFGNQWIDICRVGKVTDAGGVERDLSTEFLSQVIASYDAAHHEAPIVVGHPEDNAPAYGWVVELRLSGDRLEARFADTDDEFERLVREGKYRKRSASFYLNPPALRHVGFLGAQPPAVKGLREIQFAEGESITFENSFNLNQEINMGLEDVDQVSESLFEKFKNYFKESETETPLSLSEATKENLSKDAVMTIVAGAVKTAKEDLNAEFSEKIAAKDEQIQTLTNRINASSATGKRAEIVSFCERQGLAKVTPAMKRVGIVDFMESLETADASDAEKAVVCFSETEDGTKTEVKFSRLEWFQNFVESLPPFVQFGEKFGNLKATQSIGDAANAKKDDDDAAEMLREIGVKTGGEK